MLRQHICRQGKPRPYRLKKGNLLSPQQEYNNTSTTDHALPIVIQPKVEEDKDQPKDPKEEESASNQHDKTPDAKDKSTETK